MYIALFKFLGTVFAILPCLGKPSVLDLCTYAGIVILDVLYLVLLHRQLRRLGIRPWKRL
jgi:hypothetical protein